MDVPPGTEGFFQDNPLDLDMELERFIYDLTPIDLKIDLKIVLHTYSV